MHELSIAQSVVDIARRHAGDQRVTAVNLKVGYLRQVVPSALEFSFTLIAEGTCAEGARLAIEQIPALGRCRGCGAETQLHEFPLQCGACGDFDLEVIAGDEMLVESIEIQEADVELYSR